MIKDRKKTFNYIGVIFKTYLVLIVTMFFNRVYFLVKNRDYITEQIPVGVYIKAFGIGWIYDNAIVSYIMIFFILLYFVYTFFNFFEKNKIGKFLWLLITGFLLFVLYTVNVLDVQYFKEFGFHLNSSVSDYSSNTTEIVATFFTKEYSPVTNVSLIIIFLVSNIFLIGKILNKIEKKFDLRVVIKNLVVSLVMITLFVFGTRGSFKSATLNWGKAYFSEYNFANQLTLNGTFSFSKSYYYKLKKEKKGEIPKRFTLEEASKIVAENISNPQTDKKIAAKNPLLREVNTGKNEKKLNVVVVLMESWSQYGIKSIGGKKELTPNFDKLSKEGILFSDFYAAGGRSNRGIASVNISYPSPLDESVTKDTISSQEKFLSIANILKERNYSTHFVYGGDPHFDNMDGFLRINGIDNIVGAEHFPRKDKIIKWGVPDDKLFDYGIEYMKNLKEPFFVNFFTLSNHPPYDSAPDFKMDGDKNDPMYERDRLYMYSDFALGQFIEKVQKEKYAIDTLFVFVADHGVNLKEFVANDLKGFKIPLLLWSPNKELLQPKVVAKAGSQVDILPTVMGVLGGTYKSASWGQDLNLENKFNYAFVSNGDAHGLVYGDNYYYESKMEGERLVNKNNMSPIKNEGLKKQLKRVLDGNMDLMYYQREQGIYGTK